MVILSIIGIWNFQDQLHLPYKFYDRDMGYLLFQFCQLRTVKTKHSQLRLKMDIFNKKKKKKQHIFTASVEWSQLQNFIGPILPHIE